VFLSIGGGRDCLASKNTGAGGNVSIGGEMERGGANKQKAMKQFGGPHRGFRGAHTFNWPASPFSGPIGGGTMGGGADVGKSLWKRISGGGVR